METLVNKIIPYTLLNAAYENFETDLHAHHTLEIVYSNEGTLEFAFYADDSGQECQHISIKSHQFVLIMPWQRHNYRVREKASILVLELGYRNASLTFRQWLAQDEEARKLGFAQKLFASGRGYLIFDDTQTVFETLEKFIDLVYNHQHGAANDYYDVEYEILLLECLVKICRCNQLLVDRIPANRHIYNALLYIAENYAKKITVAKLAEFVKVSPSYLQRVFKQFYGQSLLGVITRQRILVADRLLVDTNMTLSEIAEKVGYENKRAFQIAFGKIHGIPPSEYRRKNRSNQFIFYRDYTDPGVTMDVLKKDFSESAAETKKVL